MIYFFLKFNKKKKYNPWNIKSIKEIWDRKLKILSKLHQIIQLNTECKIMIP